MAIIPTSHIEDAQKTTGDAYVRLYLIDLYGGSSVYCASEHSVTWQSNLWEGIGIKMTGEGAYASEQVSRPKLSIQNFDGLFSKFCSERVFDMAVVTRYIVLQDDIAQDNPYFLSQVWQVGRVLECNRHLITLELRGFADAPNFILPAETFSPPKFPTVSF